jgi:release factor glutamine methyltransferase
MTDPDSLRSGDESAPTVLTVGAWLVRAARRLAAVSPDSGLEAREILRSVIPIPASRLLSHPERLVAPDELIELERRVEGRLAGEPLDWLLETTSFRDLELEVPSGVFAPRPETEGLVGRLLDHLHRSPRSEPRAPFRLLELGTGTGAILLSVLKEFSDIVVCGVELSEAAANATERNALRLFSGASIDRFRLYRGDLYRPLGGHEEPGSFDVIVSNPPYIPDGLWGSLPREVRFYESPLALLGGPDGTDVIRRIAAGAPAWLRPGGLLALEIDQSHGDRVREILAESAPWSSIAIEADLAGRHRYALATLRR